MNDIAIRPISRSSEFDSLEEVQAIIWGMDDREIVPGRMMHSLQYNGACLLGAFHHDKLVGFILGVISTVEWLRQRIDQVAAARLQMYSVMMGVLPEYQGQDIGRQLKVGQRDFALRVGIRLVTWTFDPLESRNAWFNFGKLGVVCHRYLRNFHGEMSGLNAGLPTDRFHAEWWVTSNRVESRLTARRRPLTLEAFLGGGAILVNESRFNAAGRPTPPEQFIESDKRMLLIEIPANFQQIKREDMPLAQRWREHGRRIFEYYFRQEYVVSDFAHHQPPDQPARSFYLLTQREI